MITRVRLWLGISILWLGLSMLFDGVNTLVLPNRLLSLTTNANKSTVLGLLTFVGLVLGMLVQPFAGVASDRLRPRWGRRGFIAGGVLLVLLSLALFGFAASLAAIFVGFALLQVTANLAQAAQQGFIPDLIPPAQRGTAAGFKGFMDVGGALLGFVALSQLLAGGQTAPALLAIALVIGVTFLLTLLLVREPLMPLDDPPNRLTVLGAFRLDLDRHRSFAWLVAARFLFLLGTYAVGRFFLFFVADRLGLAPGQAAEQAGALLAGLTFITVVAAIPAGWMADRFGRMYVMLAGALVSALGVALLIIANGAGQILLFGGLMALGSAAFASANWAGIADLAPPHEAARFFGLANLGTAGAAAAAGLFGPLVDWVNGLAPGAGYSALFVMSALAFVASAFALRGVRSAAEQLMASALNPRR